MKYICIYLREALFWSIRQRQRNLSLPCDEEISHTNRGNYPPWKYIPMVGIRDLHPDVLGLSRQMKENLIWKEKGKERKRRRKAFSILEGKEKGKERP